MTKEFQPHQPLDTEAPEQEYIPTPVVESAHPMQRHLDVHNLITGTLGEKAPSAIRSTGRTVLHAVKNSIELSADLKPRKK